MWGWINDFFRKKNTTKLKTIQEIETILSENSVGINDFEEIVSQIRTDYKNNLQLIFTPKWKGGLRCVEI